MHQTAVYHRQCSPFATSLPLHYIALQAHTTLHCSLDCVIGWFKGILQASSPMQPFHYITSNTLHCIIHCTVAFHWIILHYIALWARLKEFCTARHPVVISTSINSNICHNSTIYLPQFHNIFTTIPQYIYHDSTIYIPQFHNIFTTILTEYRAKQQFHPNSKHPPSSAMICQKI